jgi:hypothetical protein
MPWPPEIQEAEDRMNQARDALFADVKSGEPYNAERRHALLANLKRAQDKFFEMVAQFHE